MPGVPSLDSAIARVRGGALSEGLEQLLALHSTHGPDSSEPLPDVELATLWPRSSSAGWPVVTWPAR